MFFSLIGDFKLDGLYVTLVLLVLHVSSLSCVTFVSNIVGVLVGSVGEGNVGVDCLELVGWVGKGMGGSMEERVCVCVSVEWSLVQSERVMVQPVAVHGHLVSVVVFGVIFVVFVE